jgi:hypothetical protein
MTTNHLSRQQQEECLIDRPAPTVVRHLAECVECRTAVEQLERGLNNFRNAGIAWSAELLAARPQQLLFARPQPTSRTAFRWAMAVALPLVLLICALLGVHLASPPPQHAEATKISDDALLEQVDEQLSVAVPSSMESLTHLVSTDSSNASDAAGAAQGSKHLVQTN